MKSYTLRLLFVLLILFNWSCSSQNDNCYKQTYQILQDGEEVSGFEKHLGLYHRISDETELYFDKDFVFYVSKNYNGIYDKRNKEYFKSELKKYYKNELVKSSKPLKYGHHILPEFYTAAVKWKFTGQEKNINGLACKEVEVSDTNMEYRISKFWITEKYPRADIFKLEDSFPGCIMEFDTKLYTKDPNPKNLTVRFKMEEIEMPAEFKNAKDQLIAKFERQNFSNKDIQLTQDIIDKLKYEVNYRPKKMKDLNSLLLDIPEGMDKHKVKEELSEEGEVWQSWSLDSQTGVYRHKDFRIRYEPVRVTVGKIDREDPSKNSLEGYRIYKENGWYCKENLISSALKDCYQIDSSNLIVRKKSIFGGTENRIKSYYYNSDSLATKLDYSGSIEKYFYNEDNQIKSSISERRKTEYSYYENGFVKTVVSDGYFDKRTYQCFNEGENIVCKIERTYNSGEESSKSSTAKKMIFNEYYDLIEEVYIDSNGSETKRFFRYTY